MGWIVGGSIVAFCIHVVGFYLLTLVLGFQAWAAILIACAVITLAFEAGILIHRMAEGLFDVVVAGPIFGIVFPGVVLDFLFEGGGAKTGRSKGIELIGASAAFAVAFYVATFWGMPIVTAVLIGFAVQLVQLVIFVYWKEEPVRAY